MQEDVLTDLRSRPFTVFPLAETMDMGIHVQYAGPDGAGTDCFVGDWPIWRLRGVSQTRWEQIREGIRAGMSGEDLDGTVLEEEDLDEEDQDEDEEEPDAEELVEEALHKTELGAFAEKVQYLRMDSSLTQILAGLLDLPEKAPEYMYAVFSFQLWEEDLPRFFRTEEEAVNGLQSELFWDFTPWEDLDEEELEQWVFLFEEKGSEPPVPVWEFRKENL